MRLLVRVGQPIDVEQPFGLQVQALARGDQQGELRRVREDVGDQISAEILNEIASGMEPHDRQVITRNITALGKQLDPATRTAR